MPDPSQGGGRWRDRGIHGLRSLRARTGMGDDGLTVAVPGHRVEELVAALLEVTTADNAVVGYAVADLARF